MHQPVPDEYVLFFDGGVEGDFAYYGFTVMGSGGWSIFAGRGVVTGVSGPEIGHWTGLGKGLAWLSRYRDFRPCRSLVLCGDMDVLRQLVCRGPVTVNGIPVEDGPITHHQRFRARCMVLLDGLVPEKWEIRPMDERGETARCLARVAYFDHTGKELEE